MPCKKLVANSACEELSVTSTASSRNPGEFGEKLTVSVQLASVGQLGAPALKSTPYASLKFGTAVSPENEKLRVFATAAAPICTC